MSDERKVQNRRASRKNRGWPEEFLDLPAGCKPPRVPRDEVDFDRVMLRMIPRILQAGGELEERIAELERIVSRRRGR
jgi:hypothetical protein